MDDDPYYEAHAKLIEMAWREHYAKRGKNERKQSRTD
jgi:hypothetical protein